MVEMKAVYEGQLRCSVTHGPSGERIRTDAPKDNQGRGEAFSPTDLMAAALGSCMLTIMGIYAKRHELDIAGATADITKEMTATAPRRIAKLTVTLTFGKPVGQAHRQALENAGQTCPVYKSLHPDIEKVLKFVYKE
jgi:putative redox protein